MTTKAPMTETMATQHKSSTHCRFAYYCSCRTSALHSRERLVHKAHGCGRLDTCADGCWQAIQACKGCVACTVQACRTQKLAERRHACAHGNKTELQCWSVGCLVGMLASVLRRVDQSDTFFISLWLHRYCIVTDETLIHVLCREPTQSICGCCQIVNKV